MTGDLSTWQSNVARPTRLGKQAGSRRGREDELVGDERRRARMGASGRLTPLFLFSLRCWGMRWAWRGGHDGHEHDSRVSAAKPEMEVLRRRSGRRRRRRRQWSGRTRSRRGRAAGGRGGEDRRWTRRGGPRGQRALYASAAGGLLRLRLSCPGSSASAAGRPLRLRLSRPLSPPAPEQLCLARSPPVRGGREREREQTDHRWTPKRALPPPPAVQASTAWPPAVRVRAPPPP